MPRLLIEPRPYSLIRAKKNTNPLLLPRAATSPPSLSATTLTPHPVQNEHSPHSSPYRHSPKHHPAQQQPHWYSPARPKLMPLRALRDW